MLPWICSHMICCTFPRHVWGANFHVLFRCNASFLRSNGWGFMLRRPLEVLEKIGVFFLLSSANFIWCFTWSWRSSNETTTFQQVLRRGDRGISPVVAGGTWQTSKSFSFISLPSPGLNFCRWWYPYPVRNYLFTTKKILHSGIN